MTTLCAEEQLIGERVRDRFGEWPVLLLGSRAVGTHTSTSDFDVVVVLPTVRIPTALGPLRRLARGLEHEVRAPVALNPLPSGRLRRRDSLYAWKLRREARVLSAPAGFVLPEPGAPPLTERTTFSYLASAALYLLDGLPYPYTSPEAAAPSARKSLLHLVQLRILREGRYASSLPDALHAAADPTLDALAASLHTRPGLLALRDGLDRELAPLLESAGRSAITVNARYTTLAALRRRSRLRLVLTREPIDRSLARTALALLHALTADGTADPMDLQRARRTLPSRLATPIAEWPAIRATVLREWPDAHPLGAL